MPDNAELVRRELMATVTRFRRWQRHPDSLAICEALERRLIAEAQAAKRDVTSGAARDVTPPLDPRVCPECLKRKKAHREVMAKSRAAKKGKAA